MKNKTILGSWFTEPNCKFIERKTHTKMGTYTDKIETYVYEMPKE